MSVIKYKDPVTGEWVTAPALKVVSVVEYVGGSTAGIPSDIVTEADRVASSITSKMATNSLNFIAMSDMHEMGDSDYADTNVIAKYRRANRNAGQGARLIAEKIAPDFFVNLGDLAWGSSSTSLHDWAQSVRAARGYTAGIEPLTECFFTPGNHDVDYADGYHDPDLVAGMIGAYCYKDFDTKKVRAICLNTADTTDGTNATERISGEQLQWFAGALDLSVKSNAEDWSIIVLSHHPVDWSGGSAIATPIVKCLKAYLDGTTFSMTHDGIAVSYGYAGKNKAAFIANFHGHTHCFKVDDISGTMAKRIAIPNACFGRNNEYGGTFGETSTYNKSDNGTGKNTAFCVVSIDLDKKIIYADSFGAGYDRAVSYGEAEITTYSVVNNLSNASTSNGTATIVDGSTYTATITANSGYELSSIRVTMGGVDITSTAVSGSNITIAKVTGDIVITATTTVIEVPPSYTNLVLTSTDANGNIYNGTGYQEGYRLNSSGTTSELKNAVNSGFIPYNGEVIRVWGTSSSNSGETGSYISLYDDNRGHLYSFSGSIATGSSVNGAWEAKNGKYMLTVDPANVTQTATKNHLANAKYIRVSMPACSGTNFVVTLNEPIE